MSYTCGYTIEGPKVGRRVVLWRKNCQRKVRHEGDRCWQHGGPTATEDAVEVRFTVREGGDE